MKIENLSRFRGKTRFTTVTEDGKVTVAIGPNEWTGTICRTPDGYYVDMGGLSNHQLFDLAGIVDRFTFIENVLGYTDKGRGDWPWMKSTDDILKVLVELDKLYIKEPEMEKPKSTEMEIEHPSIADMDFTPKKKHYSFNFQM